MFPRTIPYHTIPYHTIPGETKGSPSNFFRHCETFLRKFFSPKGPPSIFLLICDRMDVGKSQRVPPFSFFRHCDFFPTIKNFIFFNFFMFCDRMDVEKPQRVPPFSFSALRDFSAPLGPFFSEKFSIFEYCKREYLTLESLFAIFEPWIWRRLGPVPACLLLGVLSRISCYTFS